jgi:hypothetical protein
MVVRCSDSLPVRLGDFGLLRVAGRSFPIDRFVCMGVFSFFVVGIGCASAVAQSIYVGHIFSDLLRLLVLKKQKALACARASESEQLNRAISSLISSWPFLPSSLF